MEAVAVAAAEGEAGAVAEDDAVFAVKEGLEFLDPLEVDDGGAADAEEAVGGEAGLEGGHGLAEEVAFGADVEADVVIGGFDPIDFVHAEEEDASFGFDDEAVGGPVFGAEVGEQVGEVLVEGFGLAGADAIEGALEGGLEALAVEGFEEVIDGVDFEGFEGEAVVGGDEDDDGEGVEVEGLEDGEAIELGHLDIEEDEVGLVLFDEGDGFATVAGFADDLEVRGGFEEGAEALAGERFVIDEDGPYFHAIWVLAGADTSSGRRKGIVKAASRPPEGALLSEKVW